VPKTVDPAIWELASQFVAATLSDLDGDDIRRIAVSRERRDRLVKQAADAMQQAIEDECESMRKELGD